MKRFQECSFWEKAWRCRHYLPVPWRAFRQFIREVIRHDPTARFPLTRAPFPRSWWHLWCFAWGLEVGSAQGPMNWWYTADELQADGLFSDLGGCCDCCAPDCECCADGCGCRVLREYGVDHDF